MPITGSQKALMYCLSGVERCGATRSNYHSMQPFVAIAGVQRAVGRSTSSARVLAETLSVTEYAGENPNTAAFQVRGFEPTAGQTVRITLGSINNLDAEFDGRILAVDDTYEGTPGNAIFALSCIDESWDLRRRRVVKRYTNQSASDIAKDIITTYAPAFSTAKVQPDLPTIDQISFGGQNDTVLSALTQLANRIDGCTAKVGYNHEIFFGTSSLFVGSAPVQIDTSNTSATDVKVTRDNSQIITRALVEGGGVNALGPAAVGDTMLAVDDSSWYSSLGGIVVCGPQRLTYTGVQAGGPGTLVGPGVTPSSPANVAMASGAGVETGTHLYAYTYVTGSGESLPSPSTSVVLGLGLSDPLSAPTGLGYANSGPTAFNNGDGTRLWAYTFVNSVGETLPSPTVSGTTPGAGGPFYAGFNLPLGPSGTTARRIYRTVTGGSQLKLVATVNDNVTTGYSDRTVDGLLGANAPTSNTTAGNQASLTGIALGQSGTTSRKVYRTTTGLSQLKLLTTIADNTTTTYTDSTADASLGANVPTSDTSGLTQPSGQVLAGSTSVLVAGAGSFSSSGGLAVIGNGQQVIRYTGISGNTLTGVPSSGSGAIVAAISYNSTITAAPCLTGIPASGAGSILYAIAKGDPVNVLAIVDDTTAQTTLAAVFSGGDDGVIEDYQQDGRLSLIEATARATATLAAHSLTAITLSFSSRDLSARAGRQVTINVTNPTTINQTFTIQQVTTSNYQPALAPTRQAIASKTLIVFGDVLRLATRV